MTLTEAIQKLHAAGRIAYSCLPGARWRAGDAYLWTRRQDPPATSSISYGEYDLTDPATVGCLLALLREAANDDEVTVAHPSHNIEDDSWTVWAGGGAGAFGRGPTEGAAISAALVALAEAL